MPNRALHSVRLHDPDRAPFIAPRSVPPHGTLATLRLTAASGPHTLAACPCRTGTRLPNNALQPTNRAVSLRGIGVNLEDKTIKAISLPTRPAAERVAGHGAERCGGGERRNWGAMTGGYRDRPGLGVSTPRCATHLGGGAGFAYGALSASLHNVALCLFASLALLLAGAASACTARSAGPDDASHAGHDISAHVGDSRVHKPDAPALRLDGVASPEDGLGADHGTSSDASSDGRREAGSDGPASCLGLGVTLFTVKVLETEVCGTPFCAPGQTAAMTRVLSTTRTCRGSGYGFNVGTEVPIRIPSTISLAPGDVVNVECHVWSVCSDGCGGTLPSVKPQGPCWHLDFGCRMRCNYEQPTKVWK